MKNKWISKLLLVAFIGMMAIGCGNSEANTEPVATAQVVEENNTVEEKVEEKTETKTEEVTKENTQSAPAQTEAVAITAEDIVVEVNGVKLSVGIDLATVVDSLGSPDGYSAAKSCMGVGEDKIYTFGDVELYTIAIEGKDNLYLIQITGDTKLACGLGIGDSMDSVYEKYGTDYDDTFGTYDYLVNETDGVSFTADDSGVITYIEVFGAN